MALIPTPTLVTLITPAPVIDFELLRKRTSNVNTCGNLNNAYPHIQAPICSGQSSICTFASALQGCCDSAGSCQFYTTCNGAYASASCSGSGCLSCQASAPYCVKYNFWDSSEAVGYDGYSCGTFDPESVTVFGAVATITGGGSTVTGSTSHTSTSATTTGSTSSSSHSSSGTHTSTVSAADASSTSSTVGEVVREHKGAIIGGAVGAVVLILLVVGLCMYCCCFRGRTRRRRAEEPEGVPMVQQYVSD